MAAALPRPQAHLWPLHSQSTVSVSSPPTPRGPHTWHPQLKEAEAVSAYSFRGFSPWPTWSVSGKGAVDPSCLVHGGQEAKEEGGHQI